MDDDIIRMAREAGFADRQWSAMFFESGPYEIVTPTEALKRFFFAAAAAGAAAEREACAKVLRLGLHAQAEPVQEPVAWADKISFENAMKTGKGHDVWPKAGDYETRTGRALIGLYTAPPQRKPLPNHDQHCVDVPGYGLMAVRLVRAVERAHGIGEEK